MELYTGQTIIVDYETLDKEIINYFEEASMFEGYAIVSQTFDSIDGIYIDDQQFIIPFEAIIEVF